MSSPVIETFYEDEIIKVERPKVGVVVITLLPEGKVLEFQATIGDSPPGEEPNYGYSNNVFLMSNQGQTIEKII